MKKELVIVGNGMAAGRLVDELLAQTQLPYRITVIGDEPEGSYNRIMLSAVLAEEMQESAIIQKDRAFYRANNVRFLAGQRVQAVDADAKRLHFQEGPSLAYDHLILATGALPARIPAKNQHLAGITHFRTLADVRQMKTASSKGTDALVVGGGLLGLEAAYGLAEQGMRVTLVHRASHLMSRQLDRGAGDYLKGVMRAKNISFELCAEVDEFIGSDQVTGAVLSNGKTLNCSLAVIATGIRPNCSLAESARLATGAGIRVDDRLLTTNPDISALGECCEFEGTTFGLVEPIWRQCRVLAARLAGKAGEPFSLQPVATKLKVSGVQLFSAGEFATQSHHRELLLNDAKHQSYRKLLLRDNRIVGIVLAGDTRDGQFYFDLLQAKVDIGNQGHKLLFGQPHCDFQQPDDFCVDAQREVA